MSSQVKFIPSQQSTYFGLEMDALQLRVCPTWVRLERLVGCIRLVAGVSASSCNGPLSGGHVASDMGIISLGCLNMGPLQMSLLAQKQLCANSAKKLFTLARDPLGISCDGTTCPSAGEGPPSIWGYTSSRMTGGRRSFQDVRLT